MTCTFVAALVTLGDPGRLTGGYLYHVRMAEAAPRHDARLEFLSFAERTFPLPALDAPGVRGAVRRLRPDVVVVDSIAAAFVWPWFAGVAGALPRAPLVAMLHQPPGGIDHGPVRTAIQARLDRLAYRRTDLLLAASDSLAESLASERVSRSKIRVVPPGRDVGPVGDGEPVDLRRGRRVALLCVGNWVRRKGIDQLLEAFARLPDAAVLHLVGDDGVDPAYASQLRRRLREPDLAGRVVVHGPVPRERVGAFYGAADAFVLPSLKEPYGTVYGEAMAAGLPVVGWRAGNLPYLADDGAEGLLVEPGDVDALAAALARLVEDDDLRRKLGEAARHRAATRPTWDESAALFFRALREAHALKRHAATA